MADTPKDRKAKRPPNKNTKAKQDYNKSYGKKTTDDRASRNAARAKYEKAHGECKGDVHHKDGNPQNNALSNLECSGTTNNRGWRKGKKGSHKGGK